MNTLDLDKDMKFLRIGSLNVRVKKTTASFSNFLGVGSTSNYSSQREPQLSAIYDKDGSNNIFKWGSADNISQVHLNSISSSGDVSILIRNIIFVFHRNRIP